MTNEPTVEEIYEELKANYEKSKADYAAGRFQVMTAEELIEYINQFSKKDKKVKVMPTNID